MPRPRSASKDMVLEKAMHAFWDRGYSATSMGDLVAVTGSTRQSIYGDFGDKLGFYRACFDHYHERVVAPALTPFETANPGLEEIEAYFKTQIALAESAGLPGPGCLVGNAMTERAPADPAIRDLVERHNDRLAAAFGKALATSLPAARVPDIAKFLVVAAQGLWAISRVTASAAELRSRVATILSLLAKEMNRGG